MQRTKGIGATEDEDAVEILPLPFKKKILPTVEREYHREANTHIMKKFWENREFWKDALLMAGATLAFYIVYVVIAYWSNIVEGFSRGWNGQ